MIYKHLTHEKRCQIYALKSKGHLQKDIAQFLGVHPATISREIQRNSGMRGYRYKQAQEKADSRRHAASAGPRKMKNDLLIFIEEKLTQEQWSPEQISGYLSANNIQISHESIYRHIWEDKKSGGSLYTHLRHGGKKYNYKSHSKAGRGCIPNRIDICERPKIVEKKSRLGDWEADTIIGAHHKGAILSLVERKSKYTKLCLLTSKTAKQVVSGIINLFGSLPRPVTQTITFDNGKEFSSHEEISKACDVNCYFAKPYHAWERGLNEHTNGLVRQYLPKKTEFCNLTQEKINEIENKLNSRPRKVLDWRTPEEVLLGHRKPAKLVALHR